MTRDEETWRVDPENSHVNFTLRHLVLSEISGRVRAWRATIRINPKESMRSSVEALLDARSLDTENAERDDHIRSAEFLNVAAFPQIRFASRKLSHVEGNRYCAVGDLTIRDVTHEVTLDLEDLGRWRDAQGTVRAAFRAHASFNRQHFGLRWNQDLDTGGVVLGDKIHIALTLEAVADTNEARVEPAEVPVLS